jgi:hypothetical protein
MIVWLPKAVGNSLNLKSFSAQPLPSHLLFMLRQRAPEASRKRRVACSLFLELQDWNQFSCASLRAVKGSATSVIHSFRSSQKQITRLSLSKHLAQADAV